MTWKHFDFDEFGCNCGCGLNLINPQLIDMLDEAREIANRPFRITSGYRCEKWNRLIGGVSDSAHTHGWAADIACTNSIDRYMIMKALFRTRFERIEAAPTWLHVDIDPTKPSPALFYKKGYK